MRGGRSKMQSKRGAIHLLGLGIMAVTIFIGIILAVMFLRIHVHRILEYKFEHSLSLHYLISLFLDRSILEYLGNLKDNLASENKVSEKIKESLDKWIEDGCYEVYLGTDKLVVKGKTCRDELKNQIVVEIPLPYKPYGKLFSETKWWFR